MNNWSLLWVMVLKEIRTTFRERSQVRGIGVSVLVMVLVLGSTLYQAKGRSRHFRPSPTITKIAHAPARAAQHPTMPSALLHWMAIGIAVAVGFFFSMGYLMSAVLATFVGEKEAKTLEILLASPLSDGKLFAIKCISALLPSVGIGYAFAVASALLAGIFVPADVIALPARLLLSALVLSLPVLILVQLWFVGIGAAISARAETMKGAGQIFGVVFMVLIFGTAYGVPFLLAFFPSLHSPLLRLGDAWLKLPFATQYGSALLLFGIPAVAFITIGRACFRRDRMLT
jgi:ABC-type Na+ efflux pump permease subunit